MKYFLLQGHERALSWLTFNRDGDLLFTCSHDKRCNVWFTDGGQHLGSYDGHEGVVWCCDCSFDSSRVVTAGADMRCFVFDVSTGVIRATLEEKGPVRFVQWNRKPDQQDKVVLCRDRFTQDKPAAICVWSVPEDVDVEANGEADNDRCKCILEITEGKDFDKKATSVQWGAYDETLVSSHSDGKLIIWDAHTGKKLWETQAHQDVEIRSMKLTTDRMLAVTACRDSTAKLWNLYDRECVMEYELDRPANAIAISPLYSDPESRRMHLLYGGGQSAETITTESGGKLEAVLLHMVHGEKLGEIKGHFGPIQTLEFTPTGDGYASGAYDGLVRLHYFDDEYYTSSLLE